MTGISVSVEDVRNALFNSNFNWFQAKAHQMIEEEHYLAAEICLVLIDVDDTEWTFMVEKLMPGNDAEWQEWRDKGARPVARGVVNWQLAQILVRVAPDLKEAVDKGPDVGFLFAFVMAGGGVSVYQVPYNSEAPL